jgi:hypothetical protein
MLAKPKFFNSPSEARTAAKLALNTGQVVCSVNDVLSRIDPDEGKWFAIIVLDTDSPSTLLHARKRLPEFRVIGELFPGTYKKAQVPIEARHSTNRQANERVRHFSS